MPLSTRPIGTFCRAAAPAAPSYQAAGEHDLTVYLVLYDQHSLAVSRKLFTSVEEYIDDHYVQLQ